FQGGYREYLRHQDWRAELRAVRESGSELTELNDGHQFQEILIQLGLNSPTINCLWNLYYRVTIADAIELGLLEVINRTQAKNFTPEQFIADCRARAREEDIFQQSYMCNPLGAAANHIVDWSAIERCRYDYEIERF